MENQYTRRELCHLECWGRAKPEIDCNFGRIRGDKLRQKGQIRGIMEVRREGIKRYSADE
jgi:hypothetical protein